MPNLPWTSGAYQQGTELHVLASRLPLTRYRDVPRFLRWGKRIRKQLTNEPACAGYTVSARPFSRTFLTLSAWQDQETMMRFVRSGEHARMLVDMKGRVGNATFVEYRATRKDLPLSWAVAETNLDADRRRGGSG
jgi:hypothetical protein